MRHFNENRHLKNKVSVALNPLSHFTGGRKRGNRRTDGQTDGQTKYCNPCCARVPRVNECCCVKNGVVGSKESSKVQRRWGMTVAASC